MLPIKTNSILAEAGEGAGAGSDKLTVKVKLAFGFLVSVISLSPEVLKEKSPMVVFLLLLSAALMSPCNSV